LREKRRKRCHEGRELTNRTGQKIKKLPKLKKRRNVHTGEDLEERGYAPNVEAAEGSTQNKGKQEGGSPTAMQVGLQEGPRPAKFEERARQKEEINSDSDATGGSQETGNNVEEA